MSDGVREGRRGDAAGVHGQVAYVRRTAGLYDGGAPWIDGGPTWDEWREHYGGDGGPRERLLMLAVLEDALRAVFRPGTRHRGERAEALAWIRSGEARWPYAFLVICEYLGFDAQRLRRKVAEALLRGERLAKVRVHAPMRQKQPLSTGGNWHLERRQRVHGRRSGARGVVTA